MRVKLGDVCEKKIDAIKANYKGMIDYIDIASVDNQQKIITDTKQMTIENAPSRAKQLVFPGDILVSMVRPNLNAVALVPKISNNVLVASTGYCVLRCLPSVDTKYVFYFCQSSAFVDELVRQATGASYPAVTANIVRDCFIPLPSLDAQRHIAAILDKVTDLIAKRQAQLDKLDELVKSRFVEMFGEPGTDQKGWGMACLGNVCTINPSKSRDKRLTNDLRVSFIPMPAVTEDGKIDVSETKLYNDVKAGFTYFTEDDVLFAKITPCMENGKGAVAQGLCNGIGFGSTEFHVLRPIPGISNPHWIYTLTAFQQFRKDAASKMTGSAGQRRVPASFLKNYKVSVPPIELQNQFAAFVVHTKHIKIAKKNTIDRLKELKESLMQQYFGRGLEE